MIREGLRRSLEDHGLEVVGEAGDGQEGIRLAVALEPDVVLMDVTMPVLDGVEATRQIRLLWPSAKVVMLTMHTDADVVERALQAGAVDYLVKDCTTDDLVRAIRLAAAGESSTSPESAYSKLPDVKTQVPAAGSVPEPVISAREAQVLQLIADGLSVKEVSRTLFISGKTVKNHLASIYAKLGVRDRTQAVLRGARMGIVRLSAEDDPGPGGKQPPPAVLSR
jgi:DNA-binding NarL/FixJ family response regulator